MKGAEQLVHFKGDIEILDIGIPTERQLSDAPLFVSRSSEQVMMVKPHLDKRGVIIQIGRPFDHRSTEEFSFRDGFRREIDGLILQLCNDGLRTAPKTLSIENREEDPAVLTVAAIARDIRVQVGAVLIKTMELISGGSCEAAIQDRGTIMIQDARGYNIARVRREGAQIFLESLNSAEREVLIDGENAVGRENYGQSFFMPDARGLFHISRSHFAIYVLRRGNVITLQFKDLNSTNGTKVVIESADNEETDSGGRFERGKLSRITEIAHDREFVENAVCNDVDGALIFPDAKMYGCTAIAGKHGEKNDDGIYINPKLRAMAGGDGVTDDLHGGLACALALLSIHEDLRADIEMQKMPDRACVFLERALRTRGIHSFPNTTFGFAQERVRGDAKFVEGFIVGDYRAYVIDLMDRKIIYQSRDQTQFEYDVEFGRVRKEDFQSYRWKGIILNAIAPGQTTTKPPGFFNTAVPRGRQIMTLLMSDGISGILTSDEILNLVIRYGKEAWRYIADESRYRTGDNISICEMVSG